MALAACLTLLAALAFAQSAQAAQPGFSSDTLQPTAFDESVRDYALRGCDAEGAALGIQPASGWKVFVDGQKLTRSTTSVPITASANEAIVVGLQKRGKNVKNYHLRCLPDDFPAYTFIRERDGGPRMFSQQLGAHYGAIFSSDGVPLWWVHANGEPDNIAVMDDGTMTWAPVNARLAQVGDYEVRTLENKLIQRFKGIGDSEIDVHDIRLLPNGNYLMGAQVHYPADTSAYNGQTKARVTGIEIQEVTPKGKLVWSWSSRDHIGLDETPMRWWTNFVLSIPPYDVVHWNSVDYNGGKTMLLSFRHLDAVYEINVKTGNIVWKLGGTTTPDSLKVIGDPRGDYPFAGQHDARYLPDGTITVHDNETQHDDLPPRVVRYKINEKRGTAKLVSSLQDPRITGSVCCGSSRLLPSGDWLVDWGSNRETSAYDSDGNRLYTLRLGNGFSYRANPVTPGVVTRKQLRKAMDAMAAAPTR